MNPRLLIAATVVGLQSASIWVITAWAIWATLSGDRTSLVSALFLIGMLVAAGIWSTNVALGLFQKKTWAHTPGMILQLLVAAIGTASFSGEFGSAAIGIVLLVPAALVFYLLFSKQVRIEFGKD